MLALNTGVMQPPAKECQRPPEAEGSKESISPRTSRGKAALLRS